MRAVYKGEEFPEYVGQEVQLIGSNNEGYIIIMNGEEIDNIHDEDLKFLKGGE